MTWRKRQGLLKRSMTGNSVRAFIWLFPDIFQLFIPFYRSKSWLYFSLKHYCTQKGQNCMQCLSECNRMHTILAFLCVKGLTKPIDGWTTCDFTFYRKNSKIWDTSNNCHNCPKNRKVWRNIALMHPKDADGMANSVDLIRMLLQKQSDFGLHWLLRPICPNT